MADQKITELDANVAPLSTDLAVIVDDPGSTPATQKMTIDTLDDYLSASTKTLTNKTLTSPTINTGTFTGGGALLSSVTFETRDMTAADGDVAYTGVGFTPTSIIAFFVVSGTVVGGMGMVDSSLVEANANTRAAGTLWYADSNLFISAVVTGGYQNCVVKSFDADGFTLTWNKVTSPTGTLTIKFLCFR